MESLAIIVPKRKAEQIKRKLMEKEALRTDLQVESDSKNVYFPVSKHLDLGFEITTREFKELKPQPSDYRELVDLPTELRHLLPASFDVIGHVAIIKLADEILEYGRAIGKAIATVNKPVRTVCLDEGVKGETRTRDLRIIYGDKETLTTYKEHGLTFKVDPRTMFFSPRLATERKLIADQVTLGERVFDMFAGVGPFSILIGKTKSPEKVFACDINEHAYNLLCENIRLNKIEGIVEAHLGDAREIAKKLPMVNRVIMNLPHSAFEYLDVASEKLAEDGVIHYYEILDQSNIDSRLAEIRNRLKELDRDVKGTNFRIVKSYSPTMRYIAVDIMLL
ncbi:MAG: class I SAM-dependent methyltransferase family protein [Thermoplasmata archaeon]